MSIASENSTNVPDLQAESREIDGVIFPPNDLQSDEPPLETYPHLQQMLLLLKCLDWHWRDRNDYFSAGNLTIYYSWRKRKNEDFRGPDFFVVLDTDRRPRPSWMVWEEDGKYPNVIIELLSNSTAQVDRTTKKQLYQNTFRTPNYFWFDPNGDEFQGFELVSGQYQEIQPNSQGLLWSSQLELYLGVVENKLRYFTPESELVPTPEEDAQTAQQQAIALEQQAIAQQQQTEKLAAKLRELGIDPDAL